MKFSSVFWIQFCSFRTQAAAGFCEGTEWLPSIRRRFECLGWVGPQLPSENEDDRSDKSM